MEEKDLTYYVNNLYDLRSLSFEKLGEWREKYPYSQIVHFLMAKKCQMQGLVDDMSVFHTASFYASERKHLNHLLSKKEDEYIQEKRKEAEELSIIGTTTKQKEAAAPLKTSKASEQVDIQKEIKKKHRKSHLSPFAKWLIEKDTESTTLRDNGSDSEDDKGIKKPNIEPNKKKKKGSKKKEKLSKKEKKKMGALSQKIKDSVRKKEEIISEPLAMILAQQGHTEKAIEMYKSLSLIFPEKSSFFASQIEKLIKKE